MFRFGLLELRSFLCLLLLFPSSCTDGTGRGFVPLALVAGEGEGEIDFLVAVMGILFALAGKVAIGKESFLFDHLFVKKYSKIKICCYK